MPSRLNGVTPRLESTRLTIPCGSEFFHGQLMEPAHYQLFSRAVADYFGPGLELTVEAPAPLETQQEIEARIRSHPVVQAVQQELSGRIVNMKRQE